MTADNLPIAFLESFGRIVLSYNSMNVWELYDLNKTEDFRSYDLPPKIYVVDFPALGIGQQFLLGRHLCGPVKYDMLAEIGHKLAHICKRMGLFDGERIAQFIIYFGGKAYDMDNAQPPLIPGAMIDSTVIKYQRVEDVSAPNGFRVDRVIFLGQWWKDKIWLLLEECIASGSTIKRFGEDAVKDIFKEFRPKRIFVFPACGSFYGIQDLYRICRNNDIELVPVYNSALIDVAPKGLRLPYTDLGLRPLTLTTREFNRALRARYQDTSLCWVGDIGDSVYRIKHFLLETLDDMRIAGFDLSREDFSVWNPIIRTEKFLDLLKELFPQVFHIFEQEIKKFAR